MLNTEIFLDVLLPSSGGNTYSTGFDRRDESEFLKTHLIPKTEAKSAPEAY
jgi:hypothetical protein